MAVQAAMWRHARLAVVTLGVTMSVLLATAAIVMWLPGTPLLVVSPVQQITAHHRSEYVQLHEAHNAVVRN